MNWHTIALPTIVVGVIIYHLSQKSIPAKADPFVALSVVYLISFLITVAALIVRGDLKKGAEMFRDQGWIPIVLLGVTAVAIELGYLYAYRTGWKISTTGITVSTFTAGALAVIGILWFKEQLSPLHAVGIALCVAGIVCISLK